MSRLVVISRRVPGTTTELVSSARALAPEHEVVMEPEETELERRITEVEVVFSGLPPRLVPPARGLRWVQLGAAGAERALSRYPDARVTLTNASGVHAVPITEHVLAYLFAFARGIPASVRAQARRTWLPREERDVFELRGKHLLVVGAGAIGSELARTASALGMSVVGVRRTPSPGPVEGAERIVGPEALHDELLLADFVVLALPLTPATRLMFGAGELGRMRRSAYLVNVGRGKTVDQAELVRALREGRIAGAGLDVFEEEPLPPDSPLWDMENVVVTAHSAGETPRYGERLWAIFLDNLGRYVRGEELRNVVDRAAGY